MAGENCPGVADLYSQFHSGNASGKIRHERWADDDWDHAHIEAAIEGHDELYACRVEQGHVVSGIKVELVCDEGAHTLSSLVKGLARDGLEGMALRQGEGQ